MQGDLAPPNARRLAVGVCCAVLACAAKRADGQAPALSGYYQNVAVGVSAANGEGAGAEDAQRARLMWSPARGALSLGVAYEHTFVWRDGRQASVTTGLIDSAENAGDWLPLDWTVHEGARLSWRQRFDRLQLSYARGRMTATVGRQAVSWSTTLFLSPADPFAPFAPSDPFREYRPGIDAARVQWFAGPLTVIDFVARGSETPAGRTATVLVRGSTQLRGWEMSAWGGSLHDEPAAAIGVTRSVAGSELRAEAELRRDSTDHAVTRAAFGVDRRFGVLDRSLYIVVEYQHDPFGATRPSDLTTVATSHASGDALQVLGRDEVAAQATYQVHPLVSAELLTLRNLRDGSALFAPALSVSLTDEMTLRVGGFVTSGAGASAAGPRSEYGLVPASAYVALSVFL